MPTPPPHGLFMNCVCHPCQKQVHACKTGACRDALALFLDVSLPAMKTSVTKAVPKAGKDEYSSYQSLLDDFVRGV